MSLFTWGGERSTEERDLLGVMTKAVDVSLAVDEAEDLVVTGDEMAGENGCTI